MHATGESHPFHSVAVPPQRSLLHLKPHQFWLPKAVDAITLTIGTSRYTHWDGFSGFSPPCYHFHHLVSVLQRRLFYLLLGHC